MIRCYVELSGEAPALARAEAASAAEALGGRATDDGASSVAGLAATELPSWEAARELAGRLALAWRCLRPLATGDGIAAGLRAAAAEGGSAAVRRIGRPSRGGEDGAIRSAGAAYRDAGGSIDLERPERRFWLARSESGEERLFEEVAPVDRPAVAARRMPALPFRRPVSLPPRLARAAANLARIRPGDAVVDPFLGTGALLAEAALLGARVFGADRDPEMVRGALRNFAHLGVAAEALVVGDAGRVELGPPGTSFDAVMTDPPYGRASSTGGEGTRAILQRTLPRWADRVRPGGRVVLVVPGPADPPGPEWRDVLAIPVRVHRSLTREFRVFERAGPRANRE